MIIRSAGKPRIEHRLAQIPAPRGIDEARIRDRGEVQNIVADRYPCSPLLTVSREDPERQVLHREIAMAIGRIHPACEGGIVGPVDHGSLAFGNPVHAMS